MLEIDPGTLRLAVVMATGTGAGTLPRRLDRLQTTIIDADNTSVEVDAVVPAERFQGNFS